MERLREIDDFDYHFPRWSIIVMTLLQLAFSQIHIDTIVLLFVREIGFFLFGFIFTGIIASFFLLSTKEIDRNNVGKLFIPITLTIAFGAYTLFLMWNDIQTGSTALTFATIQSSFIFLSAGLLVYAVGALLIVKAAFARKQMEEVVQN